MGRPRVQTQRLQEDTYKNLKYYMESLDIMAQLDIDHRVLNLFRITLDK